MRDLYLSIKWAYQRIVRGYDDRLFWHLAEYVDPMIRAHVQNLLVNGFAHPSDLTEKKWKKVLATILKGMRDEPEVPFTSSVYMKYKKDRDKALVLLAFYWDNLWD